MFPLKEYHQRLHTLKKRMAHEGVEVLLISNPSNMYYLSNYSAWSFYVHQMMIVTLEDAQPIWIGRQMDAQGVSKTTWLDDHHIIPYPDYYVQSKEKHPMNFIVNILKEIGQSNRVIGIEMDAHYFTGLSYEQLTNGLPNATFKDTTTLVNMIRLIKSEREIECMRKAAKIVEQTMQAAYDKVNVGVRECDVAATIFHSQIQGTKDFGGDYTSIVPMLPTNEHTSCPHLTWTDQTYKTGDFLTLEIAGAYKRYHAPMARTMSLGPAPHKLKELSKVVEEGIQLTLDAIKPGMTAEEVERVWRRAIEKKGHTKASRLGYSVGLSFPPDWGEHTISFRQGDLSILKPNMTFHLMPGIWYEDYGIEITETILLTDKGVKTLTTFPRALYEKSCLHMSESV
ncbi:M24 family metallopeptidase [Alkalihalobacillus hemicellulosilyticus]|uniref:Xaa-Pro dipeptidase n=1 Tax=Halalkalibacter hemicellulosilyticusJCM 9152 TaxID=1236971 RepID=W4QAU9_9BACI|nr:Xaa-Pro peptidase family protein [Halalkalibacter hemicellulosilyticus]GAE29097.1 Xaa-Pro dipeptidase [Halalkalibacter hemicellulosilyticusJCM 9152]